MLVLRIVGVLALIGIGACLLLFFATRNRRYLALAFRTLQFAAIFLIAFMVFYLVERLLLIA